MDQRFTDAVARALRSSKKNPAAAAATLSSRGHAGTPSYCVLLSISHTRDGVAGISMWHNSTRRWRASTIALMTAGGAPTAPASPAPLTPSGLAIEGTL